MVKQEAETRHAVRPRTRASVWLLLLMWVVPGAATALSHVAVIVEHKGRFEVEVAATERDRQRGLMWRRELAAGAGMLLDFGKPQRVAMWMQDTYVALDMVFIAADGRIVDIRPNRRPLSKTIEQSDVAVRYVLEINAGAAAQAGLAIGDGVVIRSLQ